MSAGVSSVAARGGTHERRIFDKRSVGGVAAANPERVRFFGVPGERAFGAVHFDAEAAFAAGADLGNAVKATQFVFEMDEDGSVVVGRDLNFIECAFTGFGEGFDAATRFAAGVMDGGEIGANFRDAAAGDEHGEVHPVRTDVGDGAKLAAELGFEAPVPVGGIKQPILMKFSVNESRLADSAGCDERARFLAKRIVAEIVRDAADESGFLFDASEHLRFAGIHGERFFAEDVFACAKKGAGLFEMDMIGRADVNAGNVFVGGEFG